MYVCMHACMHVCQRIRWGISRARILMFFCAAFAGIRRLWQHSAALSGDLSVETNVSLRTSPQFSAKAVQKSEKVPARDIPYTQFAIQDSGLFGPNPWKILAPPSNYLSKKVSGQPNPWNKSWIVNSCYVNWV